MNKKVLIRPIVTEKMTSLMDLGHYAFEVERKANKIEIQKELEQRYPAIKIKEVRTMVVRGKRRRQFTKRGLVAGRTAGYKKAVVTLLPDSEKIDFFEGV